MAIVAHEKGRTCPQCGFGNSQRSNKCVVCGHGLSKHRNVKVEIDGIVFDSLKESRRYQHLYQAQKMGLIRQLKVHPKFDLMINGLKICTYEADFSYFHLGVSRQAIEDVKSEATRTAPVYRLKKKLMKAILGINVNEI